ncbi:hypothetical protein IAQ61_005466 [Plenodomus lingam]|uniref:uncharacterized protein n=1 Tax=Leptosphaeria maculans TaxID=5022 RepID=UPI00331FDE86|nr:hypothetical protein IAQ61_005466 [Plenodomus lingam]
MRPPDTASATAVTVQYSRHSRLHKPVASECLPVPIYAVVKSQDIFRCASPSALTTSSNWSDVRGHPTDCLSVAPFGSKLRQPAPSIAPLNASQGKTVIGSSVGSGPCSSGNIRDKHLVSPLMVFRH